MNKQEQQDDANMNEQQSNVNKTAPAALTPPQQIVSEQGVFESDSLWFLSCSPLLAESSEKPGVLQRDFVEKEPPPTSTNQSSAVSEQTKALNQQAREMHRREQDSRVTEVHLLGGLDHLLD